MAPDDSEFSKAVRFLRNWVWESLQGHSRSSAEYQELALLALAILLLLGQVDLLEELINANLRGEPVEDLLNLLRPTGEMPTD